MDRRQFLRAGVGSLAATSVAQAAQTEQTALPPRSADEIDRKLRKLRAQLGQVQSGDAPWGRSHAANPDAYVRDRVLHDSQLTRSAMRTLLLTSAVGEFSEEERATEPVRQLLTEQSAEADFALYGTIERLQRASAEEQAFVRQQLRDEPDLALDVIEAIDREAGSLGIATERRQHLRQIATHLTWRLRHQPLDAVLDEHVQKTLRLASKAPPVPADYTPNKEWGHRLVALREHLLQDDPPTTDTPDPTAGTTTEAEAAEALKANQLMATRGYVMIGTGTALLALGIPVVVLAAAAGGLIGIILGAVAITAGAILLITGIIFAAIAARRKKHNAGEP